MNPSVSVALVPDKAHVLVVVVDDEVHKRENNYLQALTGCPKIAGPNRSDCPPRAYSGHIWILENITLILVFH